MTDPSAFSDAKIRAAALRFCLALCSDDAEERDELSPNRIGIRVCDHREWLAAKTRKT